MTANITTATPNGPGAVASNAVLLTEAQAAALMQIHKGTLRNARCTGTLGIPFIKLTLTKRGKVRYRESDILAWLDARTHVNTRQAVDAANGEVA